MADDLTSNQFATLLERLDSQISLIAEGHSTIIRTLHEQRQEYLQLHADLRSDMNALGDNLRGQIAEVAGDVAELKTDVAELKRGQEELRADVAELKTDVAELKTDVAELKRGQEELRVEMRAGFERLDEHEVRIRTLEKAS